MSVGPSAQYLRGLGQSVTWAAALRSAALFLFRYQIDIPNHAGVMHLAKPLALGNFLAQIGQTNIGTEATNRIFFSVLSCTPAFPASQPHHRLRVFVKL